jgi:hypothetical protein
MQDFAAIHVSAVIMPFATEQVCSPKLEKALHFF